MSSPIEDRVRIVRTKPTSPILSFVHHNACPGISGGKCDCSPAWELRPVAVQKAVRR